MAKPSPSKPPPSATLSPKAARQRRLRAARLFAQGLSQAEVARQLGVSRQAASRWHARWRQGGRAGLAGPGRWGRPSRLSDRDWRRVERALLQGAQAHGFDNDLWTLPRIARLVGAGRLSQTTITGQLPPCSCRKAATTPMSWSVS